MDVFYDALDLGADETVSACHWDSHASLAVGLQSGVCLLLRLQERGGVRRSVVAEQRLVGSLLSGLGLAVRERTEVVSALALAGDSLVVLSDSCLARFWDARRMVCTQRVDVCGLIGLSPGVRQVVDGAISASHSNGGLALGFAVVGGGEEIPIWRVSNRAKFKRALTSHRSWFRVHMMPTQ